VHDLPVFRQIAPLLQGKEVYADKAYAVHIFGKLAAAMLMP